MPAILKRFALDASFEGVNRLFVRAFDNTNNGGNNVENTFIENNFIQE